MYARKCNTVRKGYCSCPVCPSVRSFPRDPTLPEISYNLFYLKRGDLIDMGRRLCQNCVKLEI